MTFEVDDRIYETSATTGTGAYALDGAATGFQAFSVLGANNYCPYFVTDGVNWEAGIGQVLTSPARLDRTTVLSSSNSDAAVNWGAGTKNLRCGLPAFLALPRDVSKSIAGGSNVTLTQTEQRCNILALTGAITADIDVVVDATPWSWVVYNNTTGGFKVTVKVTGQTGVQLAQGQRSALYCDGTDVREIVSASSRAVRKNAIINGDFNIWQRGTSFSSIASGAYCADRFLYQKVGAMVHDVSRSTDVPTVAQAGRLFNCSLLIDCTTADASIAAGDVCVVTTRIEGYNWLPLHQRTTTFSFWIKATKTGTYCVSLNNSGSDRAYTSEVTINSADTWEKKTVTATASPSAGTWDTTTGTGIELSICLAAGSDWQTTADSWQTVSTRKFATSNQVNACDSTSNNVRITGLQIEVGSVATEFEHRTFQDELALCQRYYEKSYEQGTDPGSNSSGTSLQMYSTVNSSTTSLSFVVQYKVSKRVVPSFSEYNPVNGTANSIRNITSGADFSGSVVNGSASCQLFQSNAGGAVANDIVGIHWVANAEL